MIRAMILILEYKRGDSNHERGNISEAEEKTILNDVVSLKTEWLCEIFSMWL